MDQLKVGVSELKLAGLKVKEKTSSKWKEQLRVEWIIKEKPLLGLSFRYCSRLIMNNNECFLIKIVQDQRRRRISSILDSQVHQNNESRNQRSRGNVYAVITARTRRACMLAYRQSECLFLRIPPLWRIDSNNLKCKPKIASTKRTDVLISLLSLLSDLCYLLRFFQI